RAPPAQSRAAFRRPVGIGVAHALGRAAVARRLVQRDLRHQQILARQERAARVGQQVQRTQVARKILVHKRPGARRGRGWRRRRGGRRRRRRRAAGRHRHGRRRAGRAVVGGGRLVGAGGVLPRGVAGGRRNGGRRRG